MLEADQGTSARKEFRNPFSGLHDCSDPWSTMARSFQSRKPNLSSSVILYLFLGLLSFLLVQAMFHGVIEAKSNEAVKVSFPQKLSAGQGVSQPNEGLDEDEESDDEDSREGLDD